MFTWATDIHLDHASARAKQTFIDKVKAQSTDHVLLGGDISAGPRLVDDLTWLGQQLADKKLCFVLGNHDYYGSGLAQVWADVHGLVKKVDNLTWLDHWGPVDLGDKTTLVGSGLWCDWRAGDWTTSNVWLADYQLIAEFIPLWGGNGLNRAVEIPNKPPGYYTEPLRRKVQQVAQLHAEQLASDLQRAIDGGAEKVVALTHVPPFWQASFYQGKVQGADWAVHFVCKVAGDKMAQIMTEHPEVDLTVLCGHTHGKGKADILPNLHVINGGAAYKRPVPQAKVKL